MTEGSNQLRDANFRRPISFPLDKANKTAENYHMGIGVSRGANIHSQRFPERAAVVSHDHLHDELGVCGLELFFDTQLRAPMSLQQSGYAWTSDIG